MSEAPFVGAIRTERSVKNPFAAEPWRVKISLRERCSGDGARARPDVLVDVEDVARVVGALHLHQPVVDRLAVGLADAAGIFVAAQEVDVDALAEPAERGEEAPRPGGLPLAEILAGPPDAVEGDRVRRLP